MVWRQKVQRYVKPKKVAEAKNGRFAVGDKMPWCGVGSKVDRKYSQDMNKRQKVYFER